MISQAELELTARGQRCAMRIPEVCNHDDSTTSLAHPPGCTPLSGVWACTECKEVVERRRRLEVGSDTMASMMLSGLRETLAGVWTIVGGNNDG